MSEPGIYVEIFIAASIDEIWHRTQDPDLHELWDLRFTSIDYLPKQTEDEPQRFRYATRIGFGLKVEGEGESTGTRENTTGLRTSALKFWSADSKSLIEEGAGYWKYIPSQRRAISHLVRLPSAFWNSWSMAGSSIVPATDRLGNGVEFRSASPLD